VGVVATPALPALSSALRAGAGVATLLANRVASSVTDAAEVRQRVQPCRGGGGAGVGEEDEEDEEEPRRRRRQQALEAVALLDLHGGGAGAVVGYGELLRRVRRAAVGLRRRGLGRGGVLGVGFPEVGAQAIVHQLGAWWLGAAFVPLDTSLPPARLRFLIDDAGVGVVVTASQHAAALQRVMLSGGAVLMVVESSSAACSPPPLAASVGCHGGPASPPEVDDADHAELAAPADSSGGLSHIAYTSGSSGSPKGVACRHRHLLAYCLANAHVHAVGAGSRVLLVREQATPTPKKRPRHHRIHIIARHACAGIVAATMHTAVLPSN
jgi:acyl-CoA synthetase (AMP-forming)/AMP-acid ligase II